MKSQAQIKLTEEQLAVLKPLHEQAKTDGCKSFMIVGQVFVFIRPEHPRNGYGFFVLAEDETAEQLQLLVSPEVAARTRELKFIG